MAGWGRFWLGFGGGSGGRGCWLEDVGFGWRGWLEGWLGWGLERGRFKGGVWVIGCKVGGRCWLEGGVLAGGGLGAGRLAGGSISGCLKRWAA